jgi:osmotically-inducible protein OsmY
MKSSDQAEIGLAPTQFADGDTTKGHDLKWRIMACLGGRIPEFHGIHVTVFGSTAALRGQVPSLHEKRLFLQCCRHVPGVMRVVDDMSVAEPTLLYHDPDEELL